MTTPSDPRGLRLAGSPPPLGPVRRRPDEERPPVPRGDRRTEQGEPLWREALGRALRRRRHDLGDKLVDVAARAGLSAQYLSELERGRKDPSSEMLAAVIGALGLALADLTREVNDELSRSARLTSTTQGALSPSVPAGPRPHTPLALAS